MNDFVPEAILTEEKAKNRIVEASFSCTLNLTDKRGIQVTGPFYADETVEQRNAKLDAYQNMLTRQFIMMDIAHKEAQVFGAEQELERMGERYDEFIARKNKGDKIPSQEKAVFDHYEQHRSGKVDEIKSLKAAIAEGKSKIGLV